MKIAVFISGGLGDALLMIPLLKQLKKRSTTLTGIFTSTWKCEALFEDTTLFDQVIVLHSAKFQLLKIGLKHRREFDEAYLNYFSSTSKSFLLAGIISKKIITNRFPEKLFFPFNKKIKYIKPLKEIHDATQNLRLLKPSIKDNALSDDLFELPLKKINDFSFPQSFIAVQISTANNKITYKNWAIENWIEFLKRATEKYPQLAFILVGEPNERVLAETILQQKINNVHSFVGKTTIREVIAILNASKLFVGLDGGLMHLAVSLKKPTFTLWGASDFNLYGYEKINPMKNRIVFKDIACRPCNSWINPNTTRVKSPVKCPDNACMRELSVEQVFASFTNFAEKIMP